MKKTLILLIMLSIGFGQSLWEGEKNGLFDDNRAKKIGDSITVIVLESVSTKQKSGNSLGNASSFSVGPGTGYASFLDSATSMPNESSFKATGEQSSEGTLKTEITVRVKQVLDNGELKISGTKVTNINGEKQMISISGIVRPETIMAGNKVYSTYLADARINFSQEGEINNAAQPGLITKIFNTVF